MRFISANRLKLNSKILKQKCILCNKNANVIVRTLLYGKPVNACKCCRAALDRCSVCKSDLTREGSIRPLTGVCHYCYMYNKYGPLSPDWEDLVRK
jgi:hypothetical protein